ncbi:MAG: zinc finger domain-containing protein [Candidatus Dormibacteria bacterium]
MKDLLFAQRRADALTEDCGYCNQPVGARCINPRTGEPIQHQTAHLVRLEATAATAGGFRE